MAFDCLNLVENEGEDYGSALNLLFLGVGDLRNVALTCASLPDSYTNKLLFTLNDTAVCVLARLVLFLYMLIKGNSEVVKMVTELWYSIPLSEQTYKYLAKTLEELIDIRSAEDLKSRTSELINIAEDHLKKLKGVWKRWLHLRVKGTDWILRQRIENMRKYESKYKFDPGYIQTIPKRHAISARKWIEDGDFRRTDLEVPAFAENPTLTGYDHGYHPSSVDGLYSYAVQWDGLPFCGWDYLQTKRFKDSSCLVTMFGEYIEHILQRLKNTLSKNQVKFQVVLCDCVHIKNHLETNTHYDRILTSNMMDYIILPVLLELCSHLLNHSNSCATIITETLTWAGDFGQPIRSSKSKMIRIAEADVRRYPGFENGHPKPAGFQEYVDDSWDFCNYLRALFNAYQLKKRMATQDSTRLKVPITKELGKEFKLRLRDCFRNENKIVFFKMSANRRTVSSVEGDERFLEWIPLDKE